MYKIAVLSSTRGTNLQSLIDAKQSGDLKVDITCLITNKPECGAVEKAKAAGIDVDVIEAKGRTREEVDREVIDILEKYGVELVVLGGYMRIISPLMVRQYKNRIINIHPSLLPKFTGGMDSDVHQAILDAGETETGMTIHFVEEDVDAGPIILQKKVAVDPDDRPETLKAKVQALEKEWYPKVVQLFADGEIDPDNLSL